MIWKVAAFYRFVPLENLPGLRAEIKALCAHHGLCGTILLAPEGINATIAGAPDDLDAALEKFDLMTGIKKGELKFSTAAARPFKRMKVRLKKEIITLRAPEADPAKQVGAYVDAKEWNDLLADPDVILLDTRNAYETAEGIFKNAIDPQIRTFTRFKDFVRGNLDPARDKKIAMYCTGGIRCEKASSYLLAQGFKEVYHLKGGILKYLEDVPADQSLWQGSCFVFDERETLGHGLTETS